MAFKRKGEDSAPATGDLKIVDELVKKSLQINPGLRKGMDTQGVIENLRAEAVGRARRGTSGGPPVITGPPQKDPLQQTINIFVGQKAREFPAAVQGLVAKQKELEEKFKKDLADLDKQLAGLTQESLNEIVALLRPLLSSGANPDAAVKTLSAYKELFALLRTTPEDLVRAARKK